MDTMSKARRSELMSDIRGRDTKPEISILWNLRAQGIHFRREPDLPGRPDFYLPDFNTALFVHGCFWHGCKMHGTIPKTNRNFWAEKISRNARRDKMAKRNLGRAGVRTIIVWEHQLA